MQLLASSPITSSERSEFLGQLYFPAVQLVAWIQLLTFLVVLSVYLARSRRESLLVVGSLAVLGLVETYVSLAAFLERQRFMADVPLQFVYAGQYLFRVLHYFGITGLCLGLLTVRQTSDADARGG